MKPNQLEETDWVPTLLRLEIEACKVVRLSSNSEWAGRERMIDHVGLRSQAATIRERLLTDQRLRPLYSRLNARVVDPLFWRGFLQVCEDAVFHVKAAPKTRESRSIAQKQLKAIEALARDLSQKLATYAQTALNANVSQPLEFAFVPDLIQRAGGRNAAYQMLAEDDVLVLGRLNEHVLPNPTQLIAAIADVAAEAQESPLEGTSASLEVALDSRKFVELHAFVRTFDLHWSWYESLRELRLEHAELAALACVALWLPAQVGDFSEEEFMSANIQGVIDARRTGRRKSSSGEKTGMKKQRANVTSGQEGRFAPGKNLQSPLEQCAARWNNSPVKKGTVT